MKNLIIALSLIFALGASAQAKKSKTTVNAPARTEVSNPQITVEAAAQKNVSDIAAFTPINAETQRALKELFTTKYSMLSENGELSAERKREITHSMEYRLSLIFDPATIAKVKSNTKLYNSLIN